MLQTPLETSLVEPERECRMTAETYNQDLSNTLRIPIARLGAWEHPVYQYVTFTQKDFDDIKRNFESNEVGFEPYLRYGHARYKGATGGEPATAFLSEVKQEGDVLYGHFAAVDPTVVDEIKQGKYRYASAELTRNAHSKRLGRGNVGTLLTAVALTNEPFVPGLPQNQVLSEHPSDEHFFVLNQKEREMPQDDQTGILQKLTSVLEGLTQVLTTNPFAAKGSGEEKHGAGMENLDGKAMMPEITPDETEDKKPAADATQMLKLTASAHTDTPVYENGELAKGKADQDGKGGYNPAEPKAAPAQSLTQGSACPECGESMGEDHSCEKLTASPAAPSALYENGEKVKGSDDGQALANDYRPMPEHRPEGVMAQAVALSQQAASPEAQAATAQTEQLSHTAVGVETPSARHTQEEGQTMPEANAFETRLAELEQKFSNTVSALEAENAGLKGQLDAANQQLSQLAGQAAAAAQESAELKLSQRAEALKAEGVPPVLVDEAVSAIKAAGVEQKLSMGGSESNLADVMFGLLAKLPADNRVNLKQVGAKQALSNAAGADPFAYDGIIKERMGQ